MSDWARKRAAGLVPAGRPAGLVPAARLLLTLAGLGLAAILGCSGNGPAEEPPPPVRPTATSGELSKQVHQFCGHCHAYPPPDSFPRAAWKEEVDRAYRLTTQAGVHLPAPPINDVIKYYEERAPEALPPADMVKAPGPLPVDFEPLRFAGPPGITDPAVSNINLVHLFDDRRLDVLACEMGQGLILALKPYEKNPTWQVLGKVPHPAHAEVVDLDGDGVKDILVADLGSFPPTDALCGSVVWLRGRKGGGFTPITLLDGVGRVADVQAGDFRGVGKLDLIVAAFGWNSTGEIIYLENQTESWDRPKFVPRVLDERHGVIHVPVCRLQGQGKDRPPDFVALISQEHEAIVAFLNDGHGRFRKETIYRGPHPAYGSSGIQVVDLNGDGRPDVLYTNGDTLDAPYLLKPYHSVQWLENPGKGRFPWVHHPITPMYGVHRAVAADFRGNGTLDVAAVCFLPELAFPQRQRLGLDAILFLEQTVPGRFARHLLETVTCDHVTCAAGDIYGSGRADLVTGAFTTLRAEPAAGPRPAGRLADFLTIWKNRSPRRR
jgi:hypothetical protein